MYVINFIYCIYKLVTRMLILKRNNDLSNDDNDSWSRSV